MDSLHQVAFIGHRSKVDNGSSPTPDRAQGVVGGAGVGRPGHQLAGAGLHVGGGVGVGFDTARHKNLSGGVNDGGVFLGQKARQSHGGYLFSGYANIPFTNP